MKIGTRKFVFALILFVVVSMAVSQGAGRASTSTTTPFTMNGHSFFPIGTYGYPGMDEFIYGTLNSSNPTEVSHFTDMSKGGFNLVNRWMQYAVTNQQITSPEIDWAKNYPYYINTLAFVGTTYMVYNSNTTYWNDFTNKINAIKGNNGLFAYMTVDEPEIYWLSDPVYPYPNTNSLYAYPNLATGKNKLNGSTGLDPSRQVLINSAGSYGNIPPLGTWPVALFTAFTNPPGGQAVADAFSEDTYPLLTSYAYPSPLSGAGGLCDLTWIAKDMDNILSWLPSSKPVFFCMQGYQPWNWNWTSAYWPNYRYPCLTESRFMAHSAIIHGARGLIWYGCDFLTMDPTAGIKNADGSITPTTQYAQGSAGWNADMNYWKTVEATAREISGLQQAFSIGPNDGINLNGNTSLEAIKKSWSYHTALVVANKTNATVSNAAVAGTNGVGFHKSNAKVRKQFEPYAALVNQSNGSITDTWQPWGVHVYMDNTNYKNDYDGDRISEIGCYRPSAGEFYFWTSTSGYNSARTIFLTGITGGVPVPGDFDGDGKADCCEWNSGTHVFTYSLSSTNFVGQPSCSVGSFIGNDATDLPISGDFDGDGVCDFGVYRGSNGGWWIYQSAAQKWVNYSSPFTTRSTDVPVSCDMDADGVSDLCLWNSTDGIRWTTSGSGFTDHTQVVLGNSGDKPIFADFDGDGRSDLGFYSKNAGDFYWYTSSSGYNSGKIVYLGGTSDIPVAMDLDADGKADCCVWNSTNCFRFLLSSTNWVSGGSSAVGSSGDIPLDGAW